MAIGLVQSPQSIDTCYGPVIFTLDNIAVGNSYFVLEVWDGPPAVGASVKQATLYQSPNENGAAIFDIQHVLQSFVTVNKEDFDRLGDWKFDTTNFAASQPKILSTADLESGVYYVRYGSTTAIGTAPESWSGSAGAYNYFNGYKPFYRRLFDFNTNEYGDTQYPVYRATVSGDCEGLYNCTQIDWRQLPLSDNRSIRVASESGYPYPPQINGGMEVSRHWVTSNDWATKSWINEVSLTQCAPEQWVKGIEGFRYVFMDGTTIRGDFYLPNIQINGGGPNTNVNQGAADNYPYKIISQGTGPMNLRNMKWYESSTGAEQTFRIGDLLHWTHYWVYPVASAGAFENCLNINGMMSTPMGQPQLYIRKEANCLDYDHIQISWLNSFGFRDQFTFRKKNEKRVTSSRNTYDTNEYDPSAAEWFADPEYRGQTVYSSVNEIEWTVTSDYMTDQEAITLETLFSSPDVRAEIPYAFWDDQYGYTTAAFQAVILTSNTYTRKSFRKDNLFQYELTFKLATNRKVQRG